MRPYVEQAQVERRTLRVDDVEHLRAGEVIHLEVQVSPLTAADGSLLGVNIVFDDVTVARRLQDDLEQARQQLEGAYEELQNINDPLRISTAQLDDANAFLETVLAGLRAGAVVVDHDLRIRVWNQRAEDLWGLGSTRSSASTSSTWTSDYRSSSSGRCCAACWAPRAARRSSRWKRSTGGAGRSRYG
ncbi:hypothetical protein ACWEOZ_39285 [Actinoplanes sp. NPDC004185]